MTLVSVTELSLVAEYCSTGNIDAGPLGYLGGPNVVTIDSADYCVASCQEDWPDEFCSKYPPEGVPNKPRAVDDWGPSTTSLPT